MSADHDLILQLRDSFTPAAQRFAIIQQFARSTGWRPSYELDHPSTRDLACGHLLVEHGLRPLVAITFLRPQHSFDRLNRADKYLLLSISYNNLVDWHYFPTTDGFTIIYNRTQPYHKKEISLADHPNAWLVSEFDKLVGRKPSPNLPALDDALVRTVSEWKRILASELRNENITQPISELFNAIFFVRALEDYRRVYDGSATNALLDTLRSNDHMTLRALLSSTLERLRPEHSAIPENLWDNNSLSAFDALPVDSVRQLIGDFYDNKFAPFRYDFSLISKHALSHIYEHYISHLSVSVPSQPSLFPDPPEEVPNRDIGGFYTPQYIAGFFARFLATVYTMPALRELSIADPACGSGIFLRTMLESQCDPLQRIDVTSTARRAFANVMGIDVEPNACKATRLSLSLLYLVLTGEFPQSLRIESEEALAFISNHGDLTGTFDVVVANPPFVKWERIPESWQPRVASYVSGLSAPKADLYMAFILAGLRLAKAGGFLLYVVPHTFLISHNAKRLRGKLAKECWVRFVVDLSEVHVFDDANAYPVLLILQKCPEYSIQSPLATIVRCNAYPGNALEEALDGRTASTPFYSIHQIEQSVFDDGPWHSEGPADRKLADRILRFEPMRNVISVKQGFITGMDDVFIRDAESIPSNEKAAYVPYLADREMRRYGVPEATAKAVFYPFDGEHSLTSTEVRERFPETWAYLETHAERLRARKSLNRVGHSLWWRPLWPRPPKNMLRPKIVSPHLVLFPRFGIDAAGEYAVSHSPMLFLKADEDGLEVMRYCVAVLNSSVGHWQIIRQSHKYQRGYAMLEAHTLNTFSLPSPAKVAPRLMNKIQDLVGKLTDTPSDSDADAELDEVIAQLFGVSLDDLREISNGERDSSKRY